MKTMIAVMALIAMIGVGIAGAVDVRETSWGIPFLAPDPSLKTTDAFYGARGATLIGQDYQLPAVLTGQMDRNATAKRSIFDDDPWMDTLGGSPLKTVLNLAGARSCRSQIDRLSSRITKLRFH